MNNFHPWHSISPGENSPESVTAIIEIPKGSKAKYEIDKETGLLRLDRMLFSSVMYPANYGFIPQTYCDDHDPLDILVLCSADVYPMSMIEAKVIGVMHMVDNGEQDDKIIAVLKDDPIYGKWRDISDAPKDIVQRLRHYFWTYKMLPGETTSPAVDIDDVYGREVAHEVIRQSREDYRKNFG